MKLIDLQVKLSELEKYYYRSSTSFENFKLPQLLKKLNLNYGEDALIKVGDILEINGFTDFIWSIQYTERRYNDSWLDWHRN